MKNQEADLELKVMVPLHDISFGHLVVWINGMLICGFFPSFWGGELGGCCFCVFGSGRWGRGLLKFGK